MIEKAAYREIETTADNKANRYDYFSICHQFVANIKILNELQKVRKIKHPEFS